MDNDDSRLKIAAANERRQATRKWISTFEKPIGFLVCRSFR